MFFDAFAPGGSLPMFFIGRAFLIISLVYWANTGIAGDGIVIDGDTLVVDNEIYRLQGIDAPEIAQNCVRNGKSWQCGVESADKIKALIVNGVQCTRGGKVQHDRWIATCTTNDGINVNLWMVENGWAVAYREFSKDYVDQKNAAKVESRGIWDSEFEVPKDYRRDVWESYGNDAPDPNCPIKGNINRDKVKIYHTPWGSRHYKRTKISIGKGERWLCSEGEAVNAGWRAPYR